MFHTSKHTLMYVRRALLPFTVRVTDLVSNIAENTGDV